MFCFKKVILLFAFSYDTDTLLNISNYNRLEEDSSKQSNTIAIT